MFTEKPPRMQLIVAFGAIYLIWGSTYLGIRYAIETMPPFLMAGTRFVIGGSLLYGWARWSGVGPPKIDGWRAALVAGFLLLLIGHGTVVTVEQWVPSGLTALLVATVPLWMALLEWGMPGGKRPVTQVSLGILLGFCGVALLIGIGDLRGTGTVDPLAAGMLVFCSISWAIGSLYARHARISPSPIMTSGMQMLAGGGLLFLIGAVSGEFSRLRLQMVSTQSWMAFLYLLFFGSIVAFTAYSWLATATTPSRLVTYAYVNPAVAVFLGWAVAGEPLTLRMILAMVVIVVAVVVITTAKK